MSPETTVWLPVAAGAATTTAAGAAAAVVGMTSRWPTRMLARASRPLAATIRATVVELRSAMWLTVSPGSTV